MNKPENKGGTTRRRFLAKQLAAPAVLASLAPSISSAKNGCSVYVDDEGEGVMAGNGTGSTNNYNNDGGISDGGFTVGESGGTVTYGSGGR